MTKHAHVASSPPANLPKPTAAEPPLPEVGGYDEWLLDEALADTFPASDPIAVTSRSRAFHKPPGLSPVHKADTADPSWERKPATGGIAACAVDNDEASETEALATPLHCDLCHSEIPATAAFTFEGADYVYNFCGPQCLADWCETANTHDK